jgi:hypothetical protein
MRKLAIASLLVVGVAFAGSVLAQDAAPKTDAAASPATTAAPAKHHKKHAAAAAPATDTKAAKTDAAPKTDGAAKPDANN